MARSNRSVPAEIDPLPTGEDKAVAVRAMFDAISGRYDLVNRLMTFGLDVRWRRRTVRSLGLDSGDRVLDVACGTGDLCRELDRCGYRPVGVDLSFKMLAAARSRTRLVHADALRLPFPPTSVDGLTCGFALRNFVALEPFFAEAARVIRPGGRMALLEVAEPEMAFLRWGHGWYFGHVVPRIGGLLSDKAAYRYLPRSVAYLPSVPELLDMIGGAGFAEVDRRPLTGGIAQLITARRS